MRAFVTKELFVSFSEYASETECRNTFPDVIVVNQFGVPEDHGTNNEKFIHFFGVLKNLHLKFLAVRQAYQGMVVRLGKKVNCSRFCQSAKTVECFGGVGFQLLKDQARKG